MIKQRVAQLGKVSEELALMLYCMRQLDHPEASVQPIDRLEAIDWSHFLELAGHHRVYPVIYKPVKCLAQQGGIPERVIKTLAAEFQQNTLRMLHLGSEMKAIYEWLAAQNIRTLFLKGPLLAEELYGELSLRTSCDLDLLVELSQLERVEHLLTQQGYKKDDYFSTLLSDWTWRHHHITFYHPTKAIKVEVHWRLNPGPAKEPAFEELWERRRQSRLSGWTVPMLGYEDLFLFLVTHGARHGWSRLRWLHDIDRLLHKTMDATVVGALLRKHHYTQIGGQALLLCALLLRTSIPSSYQAMMYGAKAERLAQQALYYIKQMINLHNEPLDEEVRVYHKRHLFAQMSRQQQLWFMLSFLHPYPEDAELLPLPRSLHLCYFPLRPVLWAWRKVTRRQPSLGGAK